MNTYPDFIREKETQKRELINVQYLWFGCFTKGHVSTKAKECQYHGFYKHDQELQQQNYAYLKPIYPSHYGECYKYSYCPPMPSDSKSRHPKFPLRQSTFTFYEHHFEERWFFLSNFISLSLCFSTQKFLIIYSWTMTTCTKHIRDLIVNATCIFVISKNKFLLWYNDWVYQSSTEGYWMNLVELYTVHL